MRSGIIVKLSILFAIACTVLIIALSCKNVTQAEEDQTAYKYYKSICIEPGDSLWSIACRYADGHYGTIQEYINEVKTINNLTSDTIHAFEYLVVPYF